MVSEKLAAGRQTSTSILPLESGDRLTRSEFERRYQAMPHLNKPNWLRESSTCHHLLEPPVMENRIVI